jgi:hypothetical protein
MPIACISMKAKTYSTAEVAALCEVDKSTLLRWLYLGKLAEPARRGTGMDGSGPGACESIPEGVLPKALLNKKNAPHECYQHSQDANQVTL